MGLGAAMRGGVRLVKTVALYGNGRRLGAQRDRRRSATQGKGQSQHTESFARTCHKGGARELEQGAASGLGRREIVNSAYAERAKVLRGAVLPRFRHHGVVFVCVGERAVAMRHLCEGKAEQEQNGQQSGHSDPEWPLGRVMELSVQACVYPLKRRRTWDAAKRRVGVIASCYLEAS